ncbi:hypothetical protein ACXM0N_27360 [Peribacillus simplex]
MIPVSRQKWVGKRNLNDVPETTDPKQHLQLLGYGYNLEVDFHSMHSLSAGGPGASSALACGVSL